MSDQVKLADGWKTWDCLVSGLTHRHRVSGGSIAHGHPLGDDPHDHDPDGLPFSHRARLRGHESQEPPAGLYEKISLEFSSSWPGQCYLRFEASSGAVTMVRVNAYDRAVLRNLLKEEL